MKYRVMQHENATRILRLMTANSSLQGKVGTPVAGGMILTYDPSINKVGVWVNGSYVGTIQLQ